MSGPVAAVVLAVGPALTLEPELLQAESAAKLTKPSAIREELQRSNFSSAAVTVSGERSPQLPRHRLL